MYNESSQLTEAVLCNGFTACQYTAEGRLEAVYTGNAYNRTLQIAAAYDGNGNRVYQVNYNPEKDEDFSCYYDSYDNCDYNGTGIQLKVSGGGKPHGGRADQAHRPRRRSPHQQV